MTTSVLGNRITERATLAGVTLTAAEVGQLTRYYELLTVWNRTVNLTALELEGFPGITLDRIITEAIVFKRFIGFESGVWFDLGSGGGSPALPLKILCPGLKLILVESKSKKCAFLREAVRHLDLNEATVWTGRIEDLTGAFAAGTALLVTVRGVRIDNGLLGASAELLATEGTLAMFGTGTPPEVQPFPFDYQTAIPLPAGNSSIHCFRRLPRPSR